MSFDPIADALARIQNAAQAGHKTVTVANSKLLAAVAELFQTERLIETFEVRRRDGKAYLDLTLKYRDNGRPAITGTKRVSRASQRFYAGADKLWPVRGGYGLLVVSTPEGVKTGRQAKTDGHGGEVLFEIW